MVVPYQTFRLKLVYQSILFRKLPVEIGILFLVPPAVEPDGTYFTVVGEQFGQLVVHELIITAPVAGRIRSSGSSSGSTPGSILAVPVDV